MYRDFAPPRPKFPCPAGYLFLDLFSNLISFEDVVTKLQALQGFWTHLFQSKSPDFKHWGTIMWQRIKLFFLCEVCLNAAPHPQTYYINDIFKVQIHVSFPLPLMYFVKTHCIVKLGFPGLHEVCVFMFIQKWFWISVSLRRVFLLSKPF